MNLTILASGTLIQLRQIMDGVCVCMCVCGLCV